MLNWIEYFYIGNGVPGLQGPEYVMFALIFLLILFLPSHFLSLKRREEKEKRKEKENEGN